MQNKYEGSSQLFLESRKKLFEEAMIKSKRYPRILGLFWGILIGLATFTFNQTVGIVLGVTLFLFTSWAKERVFWKFFFYKNVKYGADGDINTDNYEIPTLFQLYEPTFSFGYMNMKRMLARNKAQKESGIRNPQLRAQKEWEEINQLLEGMRGGV